MATMAFGGGPTLLQRRSFAQLKDGAHLPGYQGYCPQLKYRVGKTYGEDTHELAEEFPSEQPITKLSEFSAPKLTNPLPVPTGDNKYMCDMVPGYTGYVPRMNFKFGGTYKEDCDSCIDEFITSKNMTDTKQLALRRQVTSYPRLQPIAKDSVVTERLNLYRDMHPARGILQEDRRGWVEPPIPGYQGYIPRVKPTEVGLGCRYHRSAGNGLQLFAKEFDKQKVLQKMPATMNRPSLEPVSPQPNPSRRLYLNDGMIPKYTGYVPRRRYTFGNTYGDTTRSLSVCAHDNSSFGDYVKTQPRQRTMIM